MRVWFAARLRKYLVRKFERGAESLPKFALPVCDRTRRIYKWPDEASAGLRLAAKIRGRTLQSLVTVSSNKDPPAITWRGSQW